MALVGFAKRDYYINSVSILARLFILGYLLIFFVSSTTVRLTSTGAPHVDIAANTKIRPPLDRPVHMMTHEALTAA